MTAAHTLAKGRKSRNWWMIIAIAFVAFYVWREFDYADRWDRRERLAILDVSTGEEVVVPVIDSQSDPEMLDFLSSLCVQTIEDRNPAGLDHGLLVQFLFNPDAQKKLTDDWNGKQAEYSAKQMRSKVEIMSRHHQPIFDKDGPGVISTLIGQEINNGYDVSGKFLQEVKKVRLTLTMRPNKYRQHKNRYSMACFAFDKVYDTEVAAK